MAQIRLQLQTAVDDSHPAPPAAYIRQAAAACLNYGLKSGLSGLQLEDIKLFQAIGYIASACPDVQGITQKLQNSKYFSIVKQTNQPDILHMDLYALIVPHQRVAVASLLDAIKCQQTPGPQEAQQLPRVSKQTSSADSLPTVMHPQVGGREANSSFYDSEECMSGLFAYLACLCISMSCSQQSTSTIIDINCLPFERGDECFMVQYGKLHVIFNPTSALLQAVALAK